VAEKLLYKIIFQQKRIALLLEICLTIIFDYRLVSAVYSEIGNRMRFRHYENGVAPCGFSSSATVVEIYKIIYSCKIKG
jgi:hypothetical protein